MRISGGSTGLGVSNDRGTDPEALEHALHWLIAWSAQLQDDFLRLLGRREPAALVLLTYYSMIMHCYRDL